LSALKKPDRRTERTRRHLFDAFRDLLFERGYARTTVRDIIERADVGRSTFYEHFESKDALLEQSITPLFEVLAQCAERGPRPPHLLGVVEHFWQQRRLGRIVFTGKPRRVLAGLLAELIEERLRARAARNGVTPLVPLRMAATQLAQAQLELLAAWFPSNPTCAAGALADALHASTSAAAAALLRD
jgi:AcrR family transcriptional regulator